MERIEQLSSIAPEYDPSIPREPNIFIDGPAEFLAKRVVIELRKVEQLTAIFSDYIDAYPRDDYPVRALPALRVYDKGYRKAFDSWFIEGELYIDIIYPANLRRIENQEIPDILSSALLQQFRRPTFFNTLCEVVPGLNELGKSFNVDKSLGFELGENIVPLTQIQANFRIDLREWDNYLTSTDRTKDRPFERTIGDLEKLVGVIQGMRDDPEVEISLGIEQNIGE